MSKIKELTGIYSSKIDAPPIYRGILGSPSPLKLDALRYLTQRWFSPQALTLDAPHPSCISTKFVLT